MKNYKKLMENGMQILLQEPSWRFYAVGFHSLRTERLCFFSLQVSYYEFCRVFSSDLHHSLRSGGHFRVEAFMAKSMEEGDGWMNEWGRGDLGIHVVEDRWLGCGHGFSDFSGIRLFLNWNEKFLRIENANRESREKREEKLFFGEKIRKLKEGEGRKMTTWELTQTMSESYCANPISVVSSDGVWATSSFYQILRHPLPLLQFQLFSIFFLHFLLRFLHSHLRFPWLLIHGLVGMAIGMVFRRHPVLWDLFLNEDSDAVINSIIAVGFSFFMFLTGVKMDPFQIKTAGRLMWTLSATTLFIPLAFAFPLFLWLAKVYPTDATAICFFMLVQTFSTFPVITTLLTDMKIINSELGRLASAASLIGFMTNFAVTLFLMFVNFFAEISTLVAIKCALFSFLLFGSMVVFVRPLVLWMVKRTPEGKPVSETFVVIVLALALLSAVGTDLLGLQFMMGPFIMGLMVPEGPPLASTLADRLDLLIRGLIIPLFMTYGGYRINLYSLLRHFDPVLMLGILGITLITVVAKIVAGTLTAYFCNIPYRDGLALSVLMCAKGVVDICLLITSNEKKKMRDDVMSMSTIVVLVMATVVPFAVEKLYNPNRRYAGYQKRNILHTEKNGELKVVVCVMRKEDACAMVRLLEVYPTRESPLSLYVLHSVELLGRAAPIFIDHQMGQKQAHPSPTSIRTHHILEVFNEYNNNNNNQASSGSGAGIHAFTAVSPVTLRHEDICSLAFDKSATLIILPFHRKWNVKGTMVLDDEELRSTNCQVLERAPCSVAVYVDRRKMGEASGTTMAASGSTTRVGVLFLGGDDDREALIFGKRMARGKNVMLTVFKLISEEGEKEDDQWEKILDAETLKEIRTSSSRNMVYMEERVVEGPKTALIVRAMAAEFDLLIVGRRHVKDSPFTAGLENWSEFPELGVVGDLLASSDITSPVSVLIVQQQQLQCR